MSRRFTSVGGYAIAGAWLILALIEGLTGSMLQMFTDIVLSGFIITMTWVNGNFSRSNKELIEANQELLDALQAQQDAIRESAIAAVVAEYANAKN